MENNEKSVFDRLNSIESQNDLQAQKLDDLIKAFNEFNSQNKKNVANKVKSEVQKQHDSKNALNEFMRTSKKEYLWFGPDHEFLKAKNLLCLNMLGLILVAILSTIITSIALGFYSPFSLLENIWLIFSLITTTCAFNFKKKMSDVDLKKHSIENYIQDRDGTWRIASHKKSFIWFRRFSNISCVANIIMMWCLNQGSMSIVATIFEVLMFGLTILSLLSYSNLTCMYGNFIFYTNKNNMNQITILVFDVTGRKLMTYDDFDKKYGKTLI